MSIDADSFAWRDLCDPDTLVDWCMSEFLDLFNIFCASDVFSWLLEYFTPILVLYSAMTLVGGIFHGKPL